MNILLLEDDYLYQSSISEYLEELGFITHCADNGDEACRLIANNFYHLYILDVKVHGANGFEVLAYIKELGINAPVMMMTSLTDIKSIQTSYELGCVEYLKKPFELVELKLRLEQIMQRFYGAADEVKICDFVFNKSTKELKKGDKLIKLSAKELAIIELLLANKTYLQTTSIYEYIWDEAACSQLSDVRVYIKNIRAKTCDDFILSWRGKGYKINV